LAPFPVKKSPLFSLGRFSLRNQPSEHEKRPSSPTYPPPRRKGLFFCALQVFFPPIAAAKPPPGENAPAYPIVLSNSIGLLQLKVQMRDSFRKAMRLFPPPRRRRIAFSRFEIFSSDPQPHAQAALFSLYPDLRGGSLRPLSSPHVIISPFPSLSGKSFFLFFSFS